MLDAAQKFQRAFERYKMVDSNFCYDLMMDDGTDGSPSVRDWDDARRAIKFLKNFYDITVKVSGNLYVTSNIFFDEITMLEKLLTKLQRSEDFDLQMMAHAMRQKFDKYWGDTSKTNKLIYIAAILDPRLRFTYVESSLCNLYKHDKGVVVANEVKAALYEMFKEYKTLYGSQKELQTRGNAQVEAHVHEANDSDDDEYFGEAELRKRKEMLKKLKSEFGGGDAKTELDKYLAEEGDDDSDDFDILLWWKVNSPRFPVLSQMARDVLAVSISIVASESTFSNKGRVLDPFRSSLSPKLVEALVCTQDWLRKLSLPINVEETIEEVEKLEGEYSTMAK